MLKKAIITGANGTVGTALSAYLAQQKTTVIPWDRSAIPIDDAAAMTAFIQETAPDVVYHLATASQPTGRENEGRLVNVDWTTHLAQITAAADIKFVYTSTVQVFTDDAPGPFTTDSIPDTEEGYGYEKTLGEIRTLCEHQTSVIARLGWQIGEAPGSNNMIDYFDRQMAEHGKVEASTKWLPACSFLADTVGALVGLTIAGNGLYLLDSNTRWNFYEIATTLNEQHGGKWQIEATEDFVYDQRMTDKRAPIPALDKRLPNLPEPKPTTESAVEIPPIDEEMVEKLVEELTAAGGQPTEEAPTEDSPAE